MDTLRLTKRSRTTLHELAHLALEHLPMTFQVCELSPGRKAFFPIPLKKNPNDMTDFLYVYVESKLASGPKDQDFGFTLDDVVEETGVYLFKKNKSMVDGQTYPLAVLLTDVIEDDSLRNRIVHRVGEMREMIKLDEDFLDAATMEWNAKTSEEEFGFKRLH